MSKIAIITGATGNLGKAVTQKMVEKDLGSLEPLNLEKMINQMKRRYLIKLWI